MKTSKKKYLLDKILKNDNLNNNYIFSDFSINKFSLILLLFTFLFISILFIYNLNDDNKDLNKLRLQPGMIWEDPPLIAAFSFPIYKNNDDYINERNKAASDALSVFNIDENPYKNTLRFVEQLYRLSKDNSDNLKDIGISDRSIKIINEFTKQSKDLNLNTLRKFLIELYEEAYKNGIVNVSKDKIVKSEIIIQTSDNKRYIIQSEKLRDKTQFIEYAQDLIKKGLPNQLQLIAEEVLIKYNQPNLIYNRELTEKNMIQASESVPRTLGFVREGEIIIKNGEKLNNENIQKILSYQNTRFITSDSKFGLYYYLGNLGHCAIILFIMYIYLIKLRKRILNDTKQLIIILISLIIISILAWISINFSFTFPTDYFIVIPTFSMLIAIVFDSRTAFVSTVTMALLVSGIRNNDYVIGLLMIFSGVISAYTVRDIQSRTQVYQSMFFIFLAYILWSLIFTSENSFILNNIIINTIIAFIGAVISPLLTFGLLFLIEKYTNIATDLRIKEFDTLDHPLLLKLSELAPGTYQHTLSVAMLAERCAREINANALLTKVATYYHDIGKMFKPEYFTENQLGMENKHDSITPFKSAKIIIEHVDEGIKLAKEYKLPQRIIDFIPMHHGTSLVKHFYAKALEEYPNEAILEEDFRYKGPKPNTKETAILMICDSAEAISRIESKSVEEIEKIIEKNIQDRILDGQFDECEITFAELEKIKKTIAKTIIGMTHKRVNYKDIPNNRINN